MRFWIVSVLFAFICVGCGGSDEQESVLTSGEEAGGELEEGGTTVEGGTESTEAADEGEEGTGEEASVTEDEGGEGTEIAQEEGEEGADEAGEEGAEVPGEEGGEGTESSGDEGGEQPSEEGGENGEGGGASVVTAPVGTWLLWTESAPGCQDEDLMSTRLTVSKYAVFSVDAEGTATITFHDESYLTFRTYVFPDLEQASEDTYIVSVDESVEEVEGSNCTINRKATITLTSTLGSWAGKLDYEEYKKGGGCFSDGCEGSLELKTQDLGEPINPLFWEGKFAFGYTNEAEGVSEAGDMFFYPVPDQPYFFELDITTIPTALGPIRGKKYIAGRSDKLWGKVTELAFSLCADYYNLDMWDVNLTVDLGPEFGGTVERTLSTYDEACEETTSSTLGVLTGP